ncbi:MAG TPA: DUF2167 domain-containing protein [Candidatus Binatia bacterium]|nr:DUF2167 domain-containing protein [Candidatus Binatia bacterium]
MPAFWVLTVIGLSSTGVCRAEDQAPNLSTIDWVSGPATVSLGKAGEVKIPLGYQFTGAEGARVYLEERKNTVPKDLVGCMISASVSWPVLFEFNETGYLAEPGKSTLNQDAILQTFLQQYRRHHAADFKAGTPLSWQVPPSYEAGEHAVEWSIRAVTGSKGDTSSTCNYNQEILGRHGVLHVTTIYRGVTDLETLRQLAKSVSFKPGERYSDHQDGDKLSTLDLVGLVTLDSETQPGAAGGNGPLLKALAIGLAVLVGAALAGILLVSKMRHLRRAPASRSAPRPIAAQRSAVAAAQSAVPGPQSASVPAAVPAIPAPAPSVALKPKPASPMPAAARALNHRQPQRQQRRMMFDYNRYFTDLMSTVSNYATFPDPVQTNGHSADLDKVAATPPPPPTNGHSHGPTTAAFSANAELIAHQITFIEEQRRLMQEQSKLIEEKSKLIAEKNHLLKLQAEMIEQKLL